MSYAEKITAATPLAEGDMVLTADWASPTWVNVPDAFLVGRHPELAGGLAAGGVPVNVLPGTGAYKIIDLDALVDAAASALSSETNLGGLIRTWLSGYSHHAVDTDEECGLCDEAAPCDSGVEIVELAIALLRDAGELG